MSAMWRGLALLTVLSGCTWFDGYGPRASGEQDAAFENRPDGEVTMDGGMDAGGGGPSTDMDATPPLEPTDASDAPFGEEAGDGPTSPDPPPPDPPPPDLPPLEADLTWQPEARRIGVTDDAIWPGTQARVWLLVNGGETPHRLVSRRQEDGRDHWLDTGIYGVTSDPDAVSFTEAGAQQQWVFFARDGALNMLRYDDAFTGADGDAADALQTIEAAPGYSIAGGDVAAVTFGEGIARGIAVAAAALKGDEAGHYCVFERAAAAVEWRVACSEQPLVSDDTDLVGVVLGTEVRFYFRSVAHGLVELARAPDGSYGHRALATPRTQPIGASLVALPSELDGWLELIAVSNDATVWSGRIDPMAPFRASEGRAALSAIVANGHTGAAVKQYMALYALGQDGYLYVVATDAESTEGWQRDWYRVPGPGRDLEVTALGAITNVLDTQNADSVYELPNVLAIVGGTRATTLQAAWWTYADVFYFEHMRPQQLVPATSAQGEVSLASGAELAIAASALRSSSAPARIQLAASNDGAASWTQVELEPLPAVDDIDVTPSALEPTTAYADKRLHLLDLEWDLPADCSSPNERSQRIVYRRGDDARAIARLRAGSTDLFPVASRGRFSSPVLAVRDVPSGAAHVIFNDLELGVVQHWTLRADDSSAPPVAALSPHAFPVGALELVAGGPGQSVYAFTASDRDLRVCNASAIQDCPYVAPNRLALRSKPIAFGAPRPEPQGACAAIDGAFYRCLRDDRPYSVAVSHDKSNVLYVAYTGEGESGAGDVFLTVSSGDPGLSSWSDPIRIHSLPPSAAIELFDPEITVDREGGIFVTYSEIAPAPASRDSTVRVYRARLMGRRRPRRRLHLGAGRVRPLPARGHGRRSCAARDSAAGRAIDRIRNALAQQRSPSVAAGV